MEGETLLLSSTGKEQKCVLVLHKIVQQLNIHAVVTYRGTNKIMKFRLKSCKLAPLVIAVSSVTLNLLL